MINKDQIRRLKIVGLVFLLWTGLLGLSLLLQWLNDGLPLPQVTRQEMLNTLAYGTVLLLLVSLLQSLKKFPRLFDTKWYIFHLILSAFSFLIFNGLFTTYTISEEANFTIKQSSVGFGLVDHAFGNGFGIYALVLLLFSLVQHRYMKNPVANSALEKPQDRLKVKLASKTYFVDTLDIDYVRSANNYCEVFSTTGKHLIRMPISQLATELEPATFIRIHRSAIVNINRFSEMISSGNGDLKMKLKDGTLLNVGNKYKKEVQEKLGL